MAEKASLKEEVKKLINSILCGYQKGATIRDLNNDYSMMEGTDLPFRKLGYTDTEDFLRSIPDAVTLSWERGECFVRAVANENNKRILDLVAKQKTTSKRSSKRPARRGYGGRPPPSQGSFRRFPPRMNRPPAASGNSRPAPPPPRPTVPNFILVKVRELFAAYKDGLNSTNFEVAFSRRFGGRINYRELGFQSLFEFLMAMPDVVQLEKFAGGLYRIYAKTRPPEPRRESRQREARPSQFQRKETRPSESRMLSVSDDDDDEDGKESRSYVRVGHKWQALIRQVLEKHPDGILSTKFSAEFRSSTGEDLPFKRLGFHSLIELLSALPAIVSIERPSSMDWLLFDARLKSETRPAPQQNKDPEPEKNKLFASGLERFKEALRQVLLAHEEGVLLRELPGQFLELTGQEIPFEDLGHSTVETLVTSEQVQDILSIKYEGHGQVFAYGTPTTKKFPNLLIKLPDPKEPPRKIPMDAVGPGNCYKGLEVPRNLQYMGVYVSNVEDPGQFWIQLKGENTTDALEDLMDNLEDFYKSDFSEDYAMPDSLVKGGQVCAALFPEDNNWHRVTITDVRDDGFIEVYYVDYGSTSCVSRKSVVMLKSQFLQLPAQAIKARLANVRPLEGDFWAVTARRKLLSLVMNIPMVAMLTDVAQDGVISMCLCDTSGEEDVHISDVLVSCGLARVVHDDYSQPISTCHKATEVLLGSPKGPLGDIHKEQRTADLKLRTVGTSHVLPESAKAEQRLSETELESDTEQSEEEYVRNIKFVQLTDRHSMHLVKYNDELYCCSGEVSAFIWEKDLLRSMLHQKKAKLDKVNLRRDQQPDIFEELEEYKVKGTMEGDQLKSHITIFKLEIVIQILRLFDHDSEELVEAIQKEIDRFDPSAPYWRGLDSEEESEQDETSDLELDRTDLETACNHLQLQRKKILSQLRSDPLHVTTYVDELDKVERQLVEVRCSLNQLSKTKAPQTELTDEEKFVQMCVEEQYKDCQQQVKDKPTKSVKPVVQIPVNVSQDSSPAKKTNLVAPMPPATTHATPSSPATAAATQLNSMLSGMSVGTVSSPPVVASTPPVIATSETVLNSQVPAYVPHYGGPMVNPSAAVMTPGAAAAGNPHLPPEQQQILMQYQLAMAQMAMASQQQQRQQNLAAMQQMNAQQATGTPAFQLPQAVFNPNHVMLGQQQPQPASQQQYGPFSTIHPFSAHQGQMFGQQPQFPQAPSAGYSAAMHGQMGHAAAPQMTSDGQMGMQYGPRSVPRQTGGGSAAFGQQFGPLDNREK